jgi:hypothetical protein
VTITEIILLAGLGINLVGLLRILVQLGRLMEKLDAAHATAEENRGRINELEKMVFT